jgi:hypothetical protein
MDIFPHKICGNQIPFREAGKVVRKLIEDSWENGEVYNVFFEGKTVDSVSFFDEAFALLIKNGITIEDLKRRIQFPDIQDGDRYLLNFVLKKRLSDVSKKRIK